MTSPVRRLYVAKDKKSGMHALVRVVQREELDAPLSGVDIERANALLMARDPESLVEAAAALGPMFARTGDLAERSLTVEEALEATGKRLLRSDSKALLAECFFDPYATSAEAGGIMFEGTGRPQKASADRVVESYDYCGANPDLARLGNHFQVLVEPLQDWVLLRNLLSITLRLGGTLRKLGSPETVLEDAGFSKVERRTLDAKLVIDAPGFAIPVMFNPYFREGNLLLNDIRFDASATWPLYGRIAEVRKGRYGMSSVGTLRGCDTIKFVTGPQAEAVPGSLESRKLRPDEARWMYLVIENKGGESQKELADLLLSSLDRQLYGPRLSYSGNSMSEVLVDSYDLPTALWGLVRSHPNHYLMTCENCHRTVFSTTQGPNRRFCSDSCRVTWSKRH